MPPKLDLRRFEGNLTRAALAVASGIALGLAFPKFNLSLMAWVAFVPLFYAIEGERLKRVFWWAYLQGFASYVVSLYWIPVPLHDFAGVRIEYAILPMFLLAGVLAFYTAIAIWAGEFIARRTRVSAMLSMPIAWVALEWVRTYFPIGFPWNLLGYAAYRSLALIQFAEFTGVYGVSGLILFVNAVAYAVLFQRGSRRTRSAGLTALTVLMLVLVGFGTWRIRDLEAEKPVGSFRVAMVQGDIPQSLKWEPEFLSKSFQVYEDQTAAAAKRGADLIVWPEAAAAFLFQPNNDYPSEFAGDAAYRTALLALARSTDRPILFGAPALAMGSGVEGFYNRAYLVSAAGTVEDYYDKIELVPFGEYVPAREFLGRFVNRIVKGFGDMIPGQKRTLFEFKGAKLAVLICYESIFPDFTRIAADRGADVLVNITNDAWYGESSAPYQALAMAAMRSVETKLPMIRVANTGVSAIIEPTGKIAAATPLFERETEIEDVQWRPERTVYTIVGDLFAELCFLLTLVGLAMGYFRPRAKPVEEAAPAESALSANGHG
ncbi:MAG: apolipoprotein N-acyltransferase [Candidatus Binataceae bacterium]